MKSSCIGFTLMALLLGSSDSLAHPGPLDFNDGHYGPGGYHYHNQNHKQPQQNNTYYLQVALNNRGYNCGMPSGNYDQRTRMALIRFQQDHGFPATGRLDHQTKNALGL